MLIYVFVPAKKIIFLCETKQESLVEIFMSKIGYEKKEYIIHYDLRDEEKFACITVHVKCTQMKRTNKFTINE